MDTVGVVIWDLRGDPLGIFEIKNKKELVELVEKIGGYSVYLELEISILNNWNKEKIDHFKAYQYRYLGDSDKKVFNKHIKG